MPLRLEIEVEGDVQILREFRDFTRGVEDLRPAWPDVRDAFWAIEKEQFNYEGSAGESGAWEPLSPRYAARKAQTHPGRGILVREGYLRSSLTGENEGAIVLMGKDYLKLGSAVEYGRYHQRGTRNMPARKPISLADRNRRRLQRVIQRYLVQLSGGRRR